MAFCVWIDICRAVRDKIMHGCHPPLQKIGDLLLGGAYLFDRSTEDYDEEGETKTILLLFFLGGVASLKI